MKLISLSSWTRDFNAREWRTKNHETLHEQLDRLDRFAAGGDAPATDAAEATRRLTRTVQRSAPVCLRSDFPPTCFVGTPKRMPAWEVHMLAAAAVRLINYFVPTTELANQIADALHSGVAALDAFLIAAIAHVRLPPANGPAHLALSSIRNFPSAGSSSFGHAALASRFA